MVVELQPDDGSLSPVRTQILIQILKEEFKLETCTCRKDN